MIRSSIYSQYLEIFINMCRQNRDFWPCSPRPLPPHDEEVGGGGSQIFLTVILQFPCFCITSDFEENRRVSLHSQNVHLIFSFAHNMPKTRSSEVSGVVNPMQLQLGDKIRVDFEAGSPEAVMITHGVYIWFWFYLFSIAYHSVVIIEVNRGIAAYFEVDQKVLDLTRELERTNRGSKFRVTEIHRGCGWPFERKKSHDTN